MAALSSVLTLGPYLLWSFRASAKEQPMPTQADVLALFGMLRPHAASVPKIRLGWNGDGGYVVNDDLDGIAAAISIGIGDEISFDLALVDRGIPVAQYDGTITRPPAHSPFFSFRAMNWAQRDSISTRCLETMVADATGDPADDLLLKFDVEDAEWDALQWVYPDTLRRFRIIVGEMHWLGRVEPPDRFAKMHHAISVLCAEHIPTHVHANNCCGVSFVEGVVLPNLIEVTWLRRDRATFAPSREPMPGPLDFSCCPHDPEIRMAPFWT
jgi:methyltransferase FkbM-like protein